ncbi:hypothetical protein GCM10009430_32050 [Aquimarina litoralis]|uniref:CBM6 domain-containing protein n=2 Tax=Aquimarina litoralis TaxID=584605 RepID=A0ABP3UA03_9FLAO
MGFVTGIEAHPEHANIIYAKTDVGGVFRWKNSTNEWIPLMDGKNIGNNISSISLDRRNKNIVYANVGHKERGVLYKSIDFGKNWKPLPLNVYVEGNGRWRQTGERLSALGNFLLFSSIRDGLWRSTNGGNSWTQVTNDKLPFGVDAGQSFSVIHPNNPKVAYVGIQGHGVYKTINRGVDWNLIKGGPDIRFKPIRGTVSNSGVLYITYATGPASNSEGKVYKYNGTGTLFDITPEVRINKGFAGISVNPKNENDVITFQWDFGTRNGIHHSTDGGRTWKALPFDSKYVTTPAYYPSWSSFTNAGQIMIDPVISNRAWLTTGFAVYQTNNFRENNPSWKVVNKNLEEFVCISLTAPPNQDKELILGVADMIGMPLTKFNQVPDSKFYEDEFGVMSHTTYCTSKPNNIAYVGSTQYGSLESRTGISTDGGKTWKPFESIPKNMQNGNIAFSSKNPNILVWAPMSQSNLGLVSDKWQVDVHYTKNQGKTWKKSKGLPKRVESLRQFWFGSQSLIADPLNGNIFYLYDRRNIYRSTDGGENWMIVGNVPVDYYRVILKANPSNGNLYFINKDGGLLYKSVDKGQNWTVQSGIQNCTNFAFGKNSSNGGNHILYAVGEVDGKMDLYQLQNNNSDWTSLNSSNRLPMGLIKTMDASKNQYGKIYLGTGGRGAFVGNLSGSENGNQRTFGNRGENWVIRNQSKVEFENFDIGGQGVSYYDVDEANNGGKYRNTQVDIESNHSGHNIGWINNNEWLEYSVDVKKGKYDLIIDAASGHSNPGKIKVILDNRTLGLFDIKNTGGWQVYKKFIVKGINLNESFNNVLRFEIIGGNFNVDKFKFVNSVISKKVTFRVAGSTGEERFQVYANDQKIGNRIQATRNFKEYSFNVESVEKLRVHFVNDGFLPNGRNKNLRVDYLEVDGEKYESEEQIKNTGSWNKDSRRCGGKKSEWLHCNGYIQYDLSNRNQINTTIYSSGLSMKIFPNPVSDMLNVEFQEFPDNNESLATVKILDINGKTLFSKKCIIDKTDHKIDVSNLKDGLYFLKVSYGKNIVRTKFYKLKK